MIKYREMTAADNDSVAKLIRKNLEKYRRCDI